MSAPRIRVIGAGLAGCVRPQVRRVVMVRAVRPRRVARGRQQSGGCVVSACRLNRGRRGAGLFQLFTDSKFGGVLAIAAAAGGTIARAAIYKMVAVKVAGGFVVDCENVVEVVHAVGGEIFGSGCLLIQLKAAVNKR